MPSSLRPRIPSRRGHDAQQPCSSARARSRGAKPQLLHAAPTTNTPPTSSWGEKRRRTVHNGRTHSLSTTTTASCCTRDWANLGGDGPTGLIAELVLACDVADYVRFRTVCRPWRRCSPAPHDLPGLDRRLFPWRWIMLDTAFTDHHCHRFLNVFTGKCIRMDLPELDDEHTLLAVTPEGLLLLLHESTMVVRLLNPLTRRQPIDLPPVTPLLPPHPPLRLWVDGVGVTDDSTVAVCFGFPELLAVAKPGDKHWTVVYEDELDSSLRFAGRFYCCVRRRVMVLDTSCSNQQPRLLEAVDCRRGTSFRFCRGRERLHLVDNAGELVLVRRSLYLDIKNRKGYRLGWECTVYRVDLNARTILSARDFGGLVVFMGRYGTISVTAEAFPSITADTLYLGFDCWEKEGMSRIDGYNLADGNIEPSYYDSDDDEMVQPCSIIDCLSHCIQGRGNKLD